MKALTMTMQVLTFGLAGMLFLIAAAFLIAGALIYHIGETPCTKHV